MLTIAPIAGGGSSYYIGTPQQKIGYYLDASNRTYWGGGAKAGLGLADGEIKAEDFDSIMAGYVPGGKRIGNPTKDGGWKHDVGRDLTFSDSKSVSILMQGPRRDDILKIRRNALATTMDFAQKHYAKTRISGEIVGGQKLIWAAVNEETSRAQDPNSHTHVVLFNIVQGEDGNFRALDNPLFYQNQILLGQIYRAEVAKGVKEMGFELEAVGQHGQWEIKDIPKEVRETFSKRRQAITEKIDPQNDTAETREKICLVTRPSKQTLPPETLKEVWNKELAAHGTSFEDLSKPKILTKTHMPFSIQERVRSSMDIVAETDTQIGLHKFYSKVMDRTDGHFTIDQIENEVDRVIQTGFLEASLDKHYIARTSDLLRERLVEQEFQKGHLQSAPLVTEDRLKDVMNSDWLKNDQKTAIRHFTLLQSRFGKIQGDAGVGKTKALEIAVPIIREAGYKVIGLSTTTESTEELEKTNVFDKVMTLQRYLLVPEGDKKTVLVVDESSMIGTKQMLSLLQFTNKKKMPRVLFQGDGKQMTGVQAGQPFKNMEKMGVRSITMDEIIRQKDTRHREGIQQLTKGELRHAFETLAPEIHPVPTERLIEKAILAWRDTDNAKTPIIVQTNKQKNTINAEIKSELVQDNPSANHLTLKTWQPIHKNDAEKVFVRAYKDATHIRFNRDYKRLGIKRGNIYKVEHVNEARAELSLSKDGKQYAFRPALQNMGNGAVELYRQEERTLHEGDRIRFTRGGKMQPVNKNESATIKEIKGDTVTFDKDRGKSLTLSLKDSSIRHIDHAWASTTHAFQGKTVDHAVVLMPSRKSPLTTLESLYTSASRHRLTVSIITDDAYKLKRNIAAAIDVERIEAQIEWPERNAEPSELSIETIKDSLKNPKLTEPVMKEAENENSLEKLQEQSEKLKLAEPVAAKAIIDKIRSQRAETEKDYPKEEIQRERTHSR